jgi:hypothetical protein
MVTLRIMRADDTEIAAVNAEAVPRVGEYLWLQQGVGSEAMRTAWKVHEVAYWLRENSPHPAYEVALYVEPTPATEILK